MNVSNDIVEAIREVDARTGSFSTDEQIVFASDFTKPMISFSDPGTGKTHSVVRGLIMAQTMHRVPGRTINAMSFTKEATAELSSRYEKACKDCNMTPTVRFNTFHRICKEIVLEKYENMKIVDGRITEDSLNELQSFLSIRGFDTDDMYHIKKIYLAIEYLNHSLIYDDDNVMLSYRFKELNIDLEVFQQVRKDMFTRGIVQDTITQGDIPSYALFVLGNNPDIKEKFLKQYRIMIVDEFQDMTKLYLTVLANICECLIVIGDMKQQIYGFNGASADIVDEYLRIYPDARKANLTQSFRCKNEIADFATTIYYPNDKDVKSFSGVGDGAEIKIMPAREMDLETIVTQIKDDMETNKKYHKLRVQATIDGTLNELDREIVDYKEKSSMFLFRNNFSITPVAEELYKQSVPFRVKKFYKVMDFPIFKELSELAAIASEPCNRLVIKNITHLFPQFRKYMDNPDRNPVLEALRIMESRQQAAGNYSGANIFELKYDWDESSEEILGILARVSYRMKNSKCSCATVFNLLWPIYDKYIIEGKWWKLDKEPDFYRSLVAPIVNNKTYEEMVKEELDKEEKVMSAVEKRVGVKCYTMHSAKGLEADYVYIIDVDDGVFPNEKKLQDYIDADCEYEAAKVLREERNLLYVGITRAKERVYITYNGDCVAQLVSSPKNNKYSYLDEVYAAVRRNFDDVGAFMRMTNLKGKLKNASADQTYVSVEESSGIPIDDI